MTDAGPPDPSGPPAPAAGSGADPDGAPAPRKPRKIFLLIGTAVALALGIGLFTSVGSGPNAGGAREGSPVPAFTRQNIGPVGAPQVSVPAHGGADGTPTVLLFFGNWCTACHQELPPLAAAVQAQGKAGGALSRIHVVGVDDLDSSSSAKAFIKATGVTFPVAYDPDASVTSGTFYFDGDPFAVFVNGDGTIGRIVRGDVLTPSSFTADERALIPSGT
jgi:thiol-disulfide isomerase/thioredoxin